MPVKRTDLHLLIPEVDVLKITGAEDVRKAVESGDLKRPTDFKDLPWLLQWLLRHGRYYGGEERPCMFVALDDDEDWDERANFIKEHLKPGAFDYSEYVEPIVNLLMEKETPAANVQITRMTQQIFGRCFTKENVEIPEEILQLTESQIVKLGEVFMPWRTSAAKRDCPKVYNYIDTLVCEEMGATNKKSVVDVAHSIFNMQINAAPLLRELANDPTRSAETVVCDAVRSPTTIRLPIRETTLGGLLPKGKPITPGQTVVFLNLESCLKDEKDVKWAFSGTGSSDRRCCAEPLVLELLEKVRQELLKRKQLTPPSDKGGAFCAVDDICN